ncbi:hypothetical protein Mal15_47170 [Stieleria maiorica]|uniref:Uncharacterized protein n=1 Tax=Stieleria maiorica TaxID=2795974 RepID=A0A5B9MMA8_9BACT|nr:hypothetical protein [Stieleria maiorica]QEG00646.1 hypothetical protein Mal15_47170 [Stieleria maiorica]
MHFKQIVSVLLLAIFLLSLSVFSAVHAGKGQASFEIAQPTVLE